MLSPSTPGTLITTGTGATSAWLLQGNSLSSLGASPTQWFGTSTNDDVIMKANNAEILRLVSGGGVVIPGSALSINGVTYTFPASAPNGVLTNTGGVLSWAAAAAPAWALTGNAGTTPGTNFLGTTGSQALHIYVNNGTDNSLILNTNGSIQRDNAGNARGTSAVDLQMTRSAVTQVASGDFAVISGGMSNYADGDSSFIGGGLGNIATGGGSVVGGGSYNTASGKWSLVVGGDSNRATANYATVVGGITDSATGVRSFVGGGTDNLASNQFAVVVGGVGNKANGNRSAILGGGTNKANGDYTSILGGRGMQLDGHRSLGFNANDIVLARDMSITSNDVVVFANADLWLANNRNQASELRFYEAYNTVGAFPNTAKHIAFKSPAALTATQSYTLPLDYPSSSGMVLSSTTGGVLSWITAGSGDVAGPGSAQDNAVSRYDGTTGKLIQNSALIVEDYSTSIQNKVVVRADDGAEANISLVLSPKGTGALIADNPDGGVTGGDARGTSAVDLQMTRSFAHQIAAGNNSVISGGAHNVAGANYSVVSGGTGNIVNAQYSVVGGGILNSVSGSYSVVSGGTDNWILGNYSTVAGGNGLNLSANGSFGFLGGNTGTNDMTITTANTAVFGNTNLWLANNNSTPSELRFYEAKSGSGIFPSGAKYVAFKSPVALTATQTYELPIDYPAVTGYVLTSTTGGVLSWGDGLPDFTEGLSTSSPNATVPVASFTATNAATDVDAAFVPKGTGALLASIPDGAVAGGDKRGTNAVDLQMTRSFAHQIAAGNNSVISGGAHNVAGANYSVVSGGTGNIVNAQYSVVGGGILNSVSGSYSVVSGGTDNWILGNYSTVAGGNGLNLSANGSFGFLGGNTGTNDMTITTANTAVFGNTNLWLANNNSTPSELRFYEAKSGSGIFPSGAKYVAFKSPAALTATQTYELPIDYPSSSGMVLSSTTGGVMSWVPAGSGWGLAGNALTGTLPSSPTEFFGSTNGADVIMKAGNNEQMRLISTGGINIPLSVSSGDGVIFQGGDRYIHSYGTFNFFAGDKAGNFTMAGISNTAIGASALFSNSSGDLNSAIGRRALYSNTTGKVNTAIGAYSLLSNTTGDTNTASGYHSLYSNTVGTKNVASGSNAMFSNTTASNNVAIGTNALFAQSFNNGGVAWGSYNTAIGDEALYKNQPTSTTTGAFNAALGAAALYENTTGSYNVGLGVSALYTNTTGDFNAAVGTNSLTNNTKGTHNSALGTHALYSNTTSSYNVAVGYRALFDLSYSNTATVYSGENTAIGYEALENTQPTSTSTGIRNTALGSQSGTVNTTGSQNTYLGYRANSDAGTYSNSTAVGANARVGASNSLVLGSINGVNAATADTKVGIGTTAPTEKLEVKSGNVLLSNAGTAGTLGFQGTGSGVSTFKAGAQGGTTINYTLPTAAPTAGQSLTATAVTGSGPYAVTLGWSTANSYAKVKSTTEGVTSSATMQDDDDVVGVSIGASERWSFEGIFIVNSADATPDIKWQWVASQSITSMDYLLESVEPGSTAVTDVLVSSDASFTTSTTRNVGLTAGVDKIVKIKGSFVWGATSGTLKLQWAQNTSNANTTNLKKGSYINFTRHQ